MNACQKGLPLVFLVVFFSHQVCLANSFLFLDSDGTDPYMKYLSLKGNDQTNHLLVDKKNYRSEQAASFREGLDSEKLHKYLGFTTVLLAGLTAVTGNSKDVHYGAAYSTVAAALGTIATGYLAHGDRFAIGDGIFTEDNSHIILGTIGVVGCIAAVLLADSDGGHNHNAFGIVGGGAMAFSVIRIKW